MSNYRKLSSQATAEIEALRHQGVTLSDSDIVAINSLCWEIESPSKRVSLAKGRPIKCGNVWLWPLTIHSSDWVFNTASNFENQQYTLAYAMAHRDDDLSTVQDVDVKEWVKTIRATDDELRIAMACIIDADKRDQLECKADKGMTVAELAQHMVANYGGSFEMWERQCSIAYVFDFLETTSKQEEAEKKSAHVCKYTAILARYTDKLLRDSKNGR